MNYSWFLKKQPEAALVSAVTAWDWALGVAGHTCVDLDDPLQTPDVLISVGGDGTLLHAARVASPLGLPVVGINQGHLGFLTSLSATQALPSLLTLFENPPASERRLLLHATLLDADDRVVAEGLAMNDVVIRSADHLMTLSWAVDDRPAAVWRADGVIVATPTGSTAYNLSAGGAILEPELEAFTVVPLCPQTLTHRPMVVSAQRRMTLTHASPSPQRCALDGHDVWWIQPSHRLVIRKAEQPLLLWRSPTDDFYSTLRGKLGWNAVDASGFPLQQPRDTV
jgi:NAD+ kinase